MLGTAWLYMVASLIGYHASHWISLECACFDNTDQFVFVEGLIVFPLLANSHILLITVTPHFTSTSNTAHPIQ